MEDWIIKPRVLITRARDDAGQVFAAFKDRLEPVYYPVFTITPDWDKDKLDGFIADLDKYNWIFFTSKNSVRILLEILKERNVKISERTRIAAVGHKTAELVESYGLKISLVPHHENAVGLLAAFQSCGCHRGPQYIALPQGDAAPPTLKNGLTRYANRVKCIILYKTEPTDPGELHAVDMKNIDYFIFTSPLSVRFFKDIHNNIADSVWIAAIGEPTAEALKEHFREPDFIPEKADLNEIVEKIKERL